MPLQISQNTFHVWLFELRKESGRLGKVGYLKYLTQELGTQPTIGVDGVVSQNVSD